MPEALTFDARLARAKFRAWHRGTREADYMIGGYFDRYHASWQESELAWFERLLDQDDVDVMAWAMGTQPVPPDFGGAMMKAMQKLDYVTI
ncbi:succinate dehydrogenase assembly factor 2 [Altererythrobacter sp. MF3-039]|uniref:FAD assembly factor SdhE n=1 Tax=Altererythrobacter sp. MF3-039 TaxID=3252901 RepID=UPI00390CB17C